MTYHEVVRVVSAEPIRSEERRAVLRLHDVVRVASRSGALDGEVPVRHGQLGVDDLQAELERVGHHRVARQEPEAIVELLQETQRKGGRQSKGRDMQGRGGGGAGGKRGEGKAKYGGQRQGCQQTWCEGKKRASHVVRTVGEARVTPPEEKGGGGGGGRQGNGNQ